MSINLTSSTAGYVIDKADTTWVILAGGLVFLTVITYKIKLLFTYLRRYLFRFQVVDYFMLVIQLMQRINYQLFQCALVLQLLYL